MELDTTIMTRPRPSSRRPAMSRALQTGWSRTQRLATSSALAISTRTPPSTRRLPESRQKADDKDKNPPVKLDDAARD